MVIVISEQEIKKLEEDVKRLSDSCHQANHLYSKALSELNQMRAEAEQYRVAFTIAKAMRIEAEAELGQVKAELEKLKSSFNDWRASIGMGPWC